MTKEQFKDNVLMAMKNFIKADELNILSGVIVNQLEKVEFTENAYLATVENNNEYYIQLFNTFKGQRLSPGSMKLYNFTLNKFCDLINKPFTEVTANDIEYFLMRQNCSEVSKNNYRRNLSAFFSWMVKKRVITFNPVDEIEPYKEVRKPIENLNAEDMEMIREGCTGLNKDRNRALIEFLRSTGVRVGELTNVKISDVNFTTGKVIVYGEKTRCYRSVYLDKVALGYLRRYLMKRVVSFTSDEPLFVSSRTKQALTKDGIRACLKTIARSGKFDRRMYPHLFRKSCATSIIKRGGTVGDAGDYLGHSENTVTGKHYVFKDDSHIENIFNKYVAIV